MKYLSPPYPAPKKTGCLSAKASQFLAYGTISRIGIVAVFARSLFRGAALMSVAVIGMLAIGAIISTVWRGRSRPIG
jgi:hypothetical protein